MSGVRIVDIAPLISGGDRQRVADEIGRACRECGFFYIVGHGVDVDLYPPQGRDEAEPGWGVGEHTDCGLLTILKQDDAGGLEVKSQGEWMAAPPIPGSFICNIGDMLDRMTAGVYRSTPHRVRNVARRDRLSFPFFFDPGWNARAQPIAQADASRVAGDRDERWDQASVHDFGGTYGEYVLAKVAKVFPHLFRVAL
jgi:isopenicillin N synthase-like dioxygenase